MSALTFQDLSTELTQAIESQLDTPTGTKARCTLGREKVMVLVEYPAAGDRTPPPTDSTLDWLEQSLRQQFDTVGLPEEAADLTETGEAVAIQLFLKHLGEPKPFTARSFVWQVADGFEDLFGEPIGDREDSLHEDSIAEDSTSKDIDSENLLSEDLLSEDLLSEDVASHQTSVFQDETGSLASLETNVDEANIGVENLTTSELEEAPSAPVWPLESATISPPLSAINSPELEDTDLTDLYEPDTEGFSLPGKEPAIDLDASELELPAIDLPIAKTAGEHPSDGGFFDMEIESLSSPNAATDSELAADLEKALDANTSNLSGAQLPDYETSEGIEFNEDIFDELIASDVLPAKEQEQSQPEDQLQQSDIETWQALSAKNAARGQTAVQVGAESYNSASTQLAGAASSAVGLAGRASTSHPIEDTPVGRSDESLANSRLSGDDDPSNTQSGSSTQVDAEDWNPDLALVNEDEGKPGEDIFSLEEDDAETQERTEDLDIDRSESFDLDNNEADSLLEVDNLAVEAESLLGAGTGFDEYGSDEYGQDEYNRSEYGTAEYEPDSLDSETEPGEAAREDLYQLEQDSEDDYEEVALIDEGEVQRQREQWQQQTKGNPWFFVGAIGFFAAGLIGFILTRPCSFGACPRIETAQAEGEKALSDLTLDANLEAVTAAKRQLTRSVRSLQPIPFWSPHHAEAQAVLPQFEGQLSALDRVSTAQDLAWQAALASQGAPHSSKTWQGIAEQWREAIAILESIPADNSVRRLANKKLTEYRANLSTIKVRIDAEAKAEESLSGAQQAATIATATAKQANSLEDWESALENWELAVDRIDRIPQGTLAYNEAQALQIDYRKEMELVRDRTLKERNASRNLSKAKQLASDAKRVESEDQWTVAVQTWTAAVREVSELTPGTVAHAEAQPLTGLYQQSLERAENNRQVSLRFQPVEPSFYAACGATAMQKCTYSVSSGNVRLNLLKDYDLAINQSITPPDQRNEIDIDSDVVTQSNQLLKEITLLSTQAQVPIELYDAQGEFFARYRPDLNGFVKDRESQTISDLPTASLN